jgi:trehalose-6-phosphate synthase
LDYIKGIPQKLRAFEKLLTDHPEVKEKVVLIQVAIPTRSDVEEYKMLRKQVEGMIGMINGKHGESSHQTYRDAVFSAKCTNELQGPSLTPQSGISIAR